MTEKFVPTADCLIQVGEFIHACNIEIAEAIREAWKSNPAPTIFDPVDEQLAWMLPEE